MFELDRFVVAQEPVYENFVAELRAGRKRTHWMWFVFPQLDGLGASAMARRYAISGLAEARAYSGHGVLGPRLVECATLVLGHRGKRVRSIMGSPDDLKLHSSMTLFEVATPDEPAYAAVIDAFYDGRRDDRTLQLLGSGRDPSLRSG